MAEAQRVWVVQTCEAYEGCNLLGIFSTEAKAQAYASRWRQKWRSSDPEVDAWTVDAAGEP